MLYVAEKWTVTGRVDDTLGCIWIMLRYMTGERWKDRMLFEIVGERCALKERTLKMRGRGKGFQWLGIVRKETAGGLLRVVEEVNMSINRSAGRQRTKCRGIVHKDMEALAIKRKISARSRNTDENHCKSNPKHVRWPYTLQVKKFLMIPSRTALPVPRSASLPTWSWGGCSSSSSCGAIKIDM